MLLPKHMRTLAGHGSHVHFTHLSKATRNALANTLEASPALEKADSENLALATGYELSVLDLMKAKGIPLEKVCLLDPKGEKDLSPEDGDGRFEMFLFGVRLSPIRRHSYS
jgi:ribosome biogenesis SPOUT family RNA methylase Rps3